VSEDNVADKDTTAALSPVPIFGRFGSNTPDNLGSNLLYTLVSPLRS